MIWYQISVKQLHEFFKTLDAAMTGTSIVKVRMYNNGMRFNVDGKDYDYEVYEEGSCSTYFPIHVAQISRVIRIFENIEGFVTLTIDIYTVSITINC